MSAVKKFTSWSFSRFSDWEQCPFKAKLKYLDKIAEPPNVYMERGSQIGELAEKFLKGKIKVLPKELNLFKKEFLAFAAKVKKKTVLTVVEDTWAFTKDWALTTFDDWTGCWVRIKLDFAFSDDGKTLYITDWKTGKFRPGDIQKYSKQLEIYALGAFLKYRHIETVIPCLRYLDLGYSYPDPAKGYKQMIYTRAKDFELLKKIWTRNVKPMMSAVKFPATPNYGCKFCFYRKNNAAAGGGQCRY